MDLSDVYRCYLYPVKMLTDSHNIHLAGIVSILQMGKKVFEEEENSPIHSNPTSVATVDLNSSSNPVHLSLYLSVGFLDHQKVFEPTCLRDMSLSLGLGQP